MIKIESNPQNSYQQVQQWRADGARIALVPTMGNLHDGHMALIQRAKQLADKVVVSIFVNPMQFDRSEDFLSYPRTLEADQKKLSEAGVDLLFLPTETDIYPDGFQHSCQVFVPNLSDVLEGALRPGHFKGVTTVVTKLFNIITPDIACFGEKDFQQLAIIRKMTSDLMLPITIESVPIRRYDDGLAMSSRNVFLSPEERKTAPQLAQTLKNMAELLQQGQKTESAIRLGQQQLEEAGFRLDSLDIVDSANLAPLTLQSQQAVILVSAYLGKPRLIDNLVVELS